MTPPLRRKDKVLFTLAVVTAATQLCFREDGGKISGSDNVEEGERRYGGAARLRRLQGPLPFAKNPPTADLEAIDRESLWSTWISSLWNWMGNDWVGSKSRTSRKGRRALDSQSKPKDEKVPRLGLVRPFAPSSAFLLKESFSSWEKYVPCSPPKSNDPPTYRADLILSFSRTYNSDPEAESAVQAIRDNFKSNSRRWSHCFDDILILEADIPPREDLYAPTSMQKDPLWVNGPNRQFVHSIRSVQGTGKYDEMFLMEPDTNPRKYGWLDLLMEEVEEKKPFAILGSKYDGSSWDKFLDEIPLSLLHHINGNAVYNVSHPLLNDIVSELELEADSLYNALPYDYRISQMVVEATTGAPPEFPFKLMQTPEGENAPEFLPGKKEKFQGWWNTYSAEEGGEEMFDPIRESTVLVNMAATNFLDKHLHGDGAIVHGMGLSAPWDPSLSKISLVVSDWEGSYSDGLLSHLDASDHPFTEVVVMQPPEETSKSWWSRILSWGPLAHLFLTNHAEVKTSVPVAYHKRTSEDFMDLCDAPVSTEWFMISNAYHHLSPDVDLMFTPDDDRKPIVPYTPADTEYCVDHKACRDTLDQAQEFDPNIIEIVLDFDMLFHTSHRDEFCKLWKAKFGENGEGVFSDWMYRPGVDGPRGPTATSYVAYLRSIGVADDLYEFADRTMTGALEHFDKVHAELEEANARSYFALEETVNEMPPTRRLQAGGDYPFSCKHVGERCNRNCCSDATCQGQGRHATCVAKKKPSVNDKKKGSQKAEKTKKSESREIREERGHSILSLLYNFCVRTLMGWRQNSTI